MVIMKAEGGEVALSFGKIIHHHLLLSLEVGAAGLGMLFQDMDLTHRLVKMD